eukprot:TRINITY_DN24448_c0_g2_i1.p1 TRINITY_DN24448_c0_g2~~TRINITY_DN24448_c0_g2_i1.p1  ORF type:complete len:790 (+),score=79.13 TRINITY_DN24448_c0_g2_i1:69-2438(+)
MAYLEYMGRGEECAICFRENEEMQQLLPCKHNICKCCANKIVNLSAARGSEQLCPFCRQAFSIRRVPRGLVEICLKKLVQTSMPAEEVKRLPVELRACLLMLLTNRRLLYGDRLVELLRGYPDESLKLSYAMNLRSEDLQSAAPLLARPLRQAILDNVPMLDDAGLEAILSTSAGTLEQINVSTPSDRFTGVSLCKFASSMSRLSDLNLNGCKGLTCESFVGITRFLAPTIRYLDLTQCRRLTDEAVLTLVPFHRLQRLLLRGLWQLSTEAVLQVMLACKQLRLLDLTGCSGVSGGEVLQAAAGHSMELRELMVGALKDIGDEEVVALATSTTGASLERLNISDTAITKLAAHAIQCHCPELRSLDISWCHGVSEHAMADMVTFMPKLKVLNCRGCRMIPKEAVFFVAQLLASRALGIEERAPPKQRRRGNDLFIVTDRDDCCQSSVTSPTSAGSPASGSSSSSSRRSHTSSIESLEALNSSSSSSSNSSGSGGGSSSSSSGNSSTSAQLPAAGESSSCGSGSASGSSSGNPSLPVATNNTASSDDASNNSEGRAERKSTTKYVNGAVACGDVEMDSSNDTSRNCSTPSDTGKRSPSALHASTPSRNVAHHSEDKSPPKALIQVSDAVMERMQSHTSVDTQPLSPTAGLRTLTGAGALSVASASPTLTLSRSASATSTVTRRAGAPMSEGSAQGLGRTSPGLLRTGSESSLAMGSRRVPLSTTSSRWSTSSTSVAQNARTALVGLSNSSASGAPTSPLARTASSAWAGSSRSSLHRAATTSLRATRGQL